MLATYAQFERLHTGIYHDTRHAVTVSKLASGMASEAGFSRKDSRFVAQVALLHNADERIDAKTGECHPLAAPEVHNTLDWLLQNRDSICRHFCWTKHNFHMACVMVARTSIPFDNAPRALGEAFHGKSPVEIAAHFLSLLAPEQREDALRLSLILRFADQIANYTGNFKGVSAAISGLVRELQSSGARVNAPELQTERFLDAVGTDTNQDRALALRFGLSRDGLFGREELLGFLPTAVRRRFEANLEALKKAIAA